MNLYNNINEWLTENYLPLMNNSWLYFNATPTVVGTTAMNSVAGNRVTKRFIDGTKQHELLFGIDMITQYDNQGTSDINMQAMDEVNKFAEWLDTLSVDNYPDFGENNTILKIEVLTNVPNLLIDSTQQLAKYQFQTRITYNEERSLKA